MFKKPNILCCGGGLQLLNSPCLSSPPRYRAFPSQSRYSARRYATASHNPETDLSWPSSPTFTPYELFKQDRTAPYSKARYYEMVKIYHPDRPCSGHPLCRDLTPEVRLQRYHILVAAHEILSDPSRRAAYDFSGAGWNLHPYETPIPSWARTGSSNYGPIYANATWEDWERWNNRHQGKQQTLVDHRTFATFVILLTLMGGALQASWISKLSSGYEDRLWELNEESSRLLKGRRENTQHQMQSVDARVQHFLIRRDPSGCGLKEEEQPVYKQVLHSQKSSNDPPAEILGSERQDVLVSSGHQRQWKELNNALVSAITDIVERWWTNSVSRFPERMPLKPAEEDLLRVCYVPPPTVHPAAASGTFSQQHDISDPIEEFPRHRDCSYEEAPPRYFALQVLREDRCRGGVLS
ncbi:hypothetical protein CBS147346_6302 [Aspergillus niger]|nr:hypothetical protein CBS147346_6302 [Aspergillus niger]